MTSLLNKEFYRQGKHQSIYPKLCIPKLAVGRLVGKPLDARLMLIKSAQDMVKTQKTVHPSEQEALDYMENRLAISAAT